jgi:hypothetical protein
MDGSFTRSSVVQAVTTFPKCYGNQEVHCRVQNGAVVPTPNESSSVHTSAFWLSEVALPDELKV